MPISDDRFILNALTELTTTFVPLKGEEYFQAICRYIVEYFAFDYSFIGKLDKEGNSVDIVSGWAKDKSMESFNYSLENTPCENVIAYDYAIYPKDVQLTFPKDSLIADMGIEAYSGIALINKNEEPIGIFAVMSKKAFENQKLVEEVLKLYVGSISAEMQRHTAEKETINLKNIAYYDPLTKLPNRLLIADRIKRAIKNYSREQKNIVAICLMDLDGFKAVNDTLGHDAGDYVLIEASRRIENTIRPEDTIARLGGDEFIIVLTDVATSEDVARVLLRILRAVSSQYMYENNVIDTISASIGVTLYPEDNSEGDTLIRHADQAMYKAKENGKDQFYFFDLKEHVKVKANFKALKKIETAIDNGEFELYIQPKLSAHNLKIESAEVLTRWNHPILGVLSPSEFLPLIEHDDLVYKFDEWVIRESLLGIKRLKETGIDILLSINISPKQFKQNTFAQKVKKIASDNGIDNLYFKSIEFEIIESSALESINHTNEIIKELKKMGIRFALDDFGTGYSSLTHLKELNINTIKIDRSFVSEMLYSSQDMAIVNAVISLSKVFQIDVVAEGAENIEQLLMLFDLGCDSVQGYTVAKPMNFETFIPYIKNYTSDPRWKIVSNTLPRRADFELLLAKSNHKYWVELIVDSLKRNELENLPQLSHKSCRLGKWLNNSGKKYFSKLESFKELIVVHKKIHKEVNAIVDIIKKSSYHAKEDDIQKIISLKDELMLIIDKLKEEHANKSSSLKGF